MSEADMLHGAELEIREALPDDAHAIAALYVWHVLNGRASFEDIPPVSYTHLTLPTICSV